MHLFKQLLFASFSRPGQVILAGERLAEDVDLGRVADRTDGFSGSDLRQVCTAAAMIPLRELLKATGKSAEAEVSSTARLPNPPHSSMGGSNQVHSSSNAYKELASELALYMHRHGDLLAEECQAKSAKAGSQQHSAYDSARKRGANDKQCYRGHSKWTHQHKRGDLSDYGQQRRGRDRL